MERHSKILGLALASVCVFSCGNKVGETADASSSTTVGPSTSETSGEGTTSSTQGETSGLTEPTTDDPTTGGPTTTEDPTTDDSSEETCGVFVQCADLPPAVTCSTYEEDCLEGMKCMPFADQGASSWNTLKCTEVTGDGIHGDPCTVEGIGLSGIDDCALHHMCWGVDPETKMGHCISFCDGSPEDAACDEPDTSCVIENGGVLNICLPTCNPLIQDCPESQACYPVNNNYFCVLIAVPDDVGFEGGPCYGINTCQPGFACIEAEQLPTCDDSKCCAPFCDLTEQDPCSNPEAQCIAVYEENESDPNIGFCGAMP